MEKELRNRKFFGNMESVSKEHPAKIAFCYVGKGDFFLYDDVLYMKYSETHAFPISNELQKEESFHKETFVTPAIVDFYC